MISGKGLNVHSHDPSATVQILFTVNITALLYYYLRSCRTDPGIVKATEEEKKKVRTGCDWLVCCHTLMGCEPKKKKRISDYFFPKMVSIILGSSYYTDVQYIQVLYIYRGIGYDRFLR